MLIAAPLSFPPTSDAAQPPIETTPTARPAAKTSFRHQQQPTTRDESPQRSEPCTAIPHNGQRVRNRLARRCNTIAGTLLTRLSQLESYYRVGDRGRHVISSMVLLSQGREPSVCSLPPFPDQHPKLTHLSARLWRSSIILSIASCFLMWAITFLAQLNPIIHPRRADLREEYIHH